MKLKTEELKRAVDMLKLNLDITTVVRSALYFKVKNNKLRLSTTSGDIDLFVTFDVDSSDCAFSVECVPFYNFISKISTEEIELTITGNVLKVKANGNYKFPTIVDSNGKTLTFDSAIMTDINLIHVASESGTCTQEDIAVLKTLQVSSAKDDAMQYMPSFCHIYVGKECAVASDTVKASFYSKNIFDADVLISKNLLNILSKFPSDIKFARYAQKDAYLSFQSENYLLIMRDFDKQLYDDFQYSDMCTLIEDTTHNIKCDRQEFASMLSRFVLFSNDLGLNAYNNKIDCTDNQKSFDETIQSQGIAEIMVKVDAPTLLSYVSKVRSEDLYMQLTSNSIMIIDNDITHIIEANQDF